MAILGIFLSTGLALAKDPDPDVCKFLIFKIPPRDVFKWMGWKPEDYHWKITYLSNQTQNTRRAEGAPFVDLPQVGTVIAPFNAGNWSHFFLNHGTLIHQNYYLMGPDRVTPIVGLSVFDQADEKLLEVAEKNFLKGRRLFDQWVEDIRILDFRGESLFHSSPHIGTHDGMDLPNWKGLEETITEQLNLLELNRNSKRTPKVQVTQAAPRIQYLNYKKIEKEHSQVVQAAINFPTEENLNVLKMISKKFPHIEFELRLVMVGNIASFMRVKNGEISL